MSKAKGFR